MPIYPSHIQAFINAAPSVPGLDKKALVDRYYDYLQLRDLPDTSANFSIYSFAYMDGHVGGFADGIKYAKP